MAQTQETANKRKNVTFKSNGLTVECYFSPSGKVERKIERYDRQSVEYAYHYDAKGHLTKVFRDNKLTESYNYNAAGQRIEQEREYQGFSDASSGRLLYDGQGRLVRAGDIVFYYDRRGALSESCDNQGVTKYFYDEDTMLDRVTLPSGAEIRYEYDKSNPIGPARRYRGNILTAEYVWDGPFRLATYRDHSSLLEYAFDHNRSGTLDKVRISAFTPGKKKEADTDWLAELGAQNRRERLHARLGSSLPLELFCGCDQAGTLRILTDKNGRLVKEILRDSFGIQIWDSFPDLFMPLGFAGGLTDSDTGLVRFGWRDYNPQTGRFTAPDPARDMRGDGDIYDYCVDDPVGFTDRAGLFGEPVQEKIEGKKECSYGWYSPLFCDKDTDEHKAATRQLVRAVEEFEGILEIPDPIMTILRFCSPEFEEGYQRAEKQRLQKRQERRARYGR